MLFTVLQTQNIGVLFIIVYGRISGRLYESFGGLKPRKKSFLVDKNSERKPEKTVDSRNNKVFWEEFLCIKFHPGFLKTF